MHATGQFSRREKHAEANGGAIAAVTYLVVLGLLVATGFDYVNLASWATCALVFSTLSVSLAAIIGTEARLERLAPDEST